MYFLIWNNITIWYYYELSLCKSVIRTQICIAVHHPCLSSSLWQPTAKEKGQCWNLGSPCQKAWSLTHLVFLFPLTLNFEIIQNNRSISKTVQKCPYILYPDSLKAKILLHLLFILSICTNFFLNHLTVADTMSPFP